MLNLFLLNLSKIPVTIQVCVTTQNMHVVGVD